MEFRRQILFPASFGDHHASLSDYIFQINADAIGDAHDGFKGRLAQSPLHVADGLLRQTTFRRQRVFGNAPPFAFLAEQFDDLHAQGVLFDA